MKTVEILMFEGCPHVSAARERVDAAIMDAGISASVETVLVHNDEEARRLRFLGSPTVRIGGVDVEPGAAGRTDFALRCRIYNVDGRLVGTPSLQWIAQALRG